MKKFHLLILLVAISLFGCRSRSSNAVITYKIAGLENGVSVTPTQNGQLMLDVTRIAAVVAKEDLTFSLSGLPDGVKALIEPKTGTPPFTATITFQDSNAVAGSYSVKLLVHSTTSGDNSYSFTLTVSGVTVVPCNIAGSYLNSSAACTANGTYDFHETVVNDSLTPNKIVFKSFASMGYPVYGYVDCATSTISIPSQALPNFLTVSGGGSFLTDSTTTIWVNYTTVTGAGDTSHCSFTLRP